MAGPRRIWILTGPALVILGLFGLVLARFWLASAPDLPAFVGARTPRFRELVGPAEFSPQALPMLGRVLDPGGDPVGEVLVYARPLGVPTWSVSDEQGRFRLDWPRVDGSEETPALLAISAWGFPPVERETRWQAEELEIRLPERESVPPPIPQPVPAPLAGRFVLIGTPVILPLAYLVRSLPVTGRSAFAGLRQFDPSLEEAAASLGAGRWRTLRRVVLPMVRPALAAGAGLAFITALGDFVTSIVLYTYDTRPISIEILSNLRLQETGIASAYGVFLMIASALAFVVWSRTEASR